MMLIGRTKKTDHTDIRDCISLCSCRVPDPYSRTLALRDLAGTRDHCRNRPYPHNRLASLCTLSGYRKMVRTLTKRSGHMRRHKIENLAWKEVLWRPEKVEIVCEMFCHVASISPRGAVVWEIRAQHGEVRYFLGADSKYIDNICKAIKAHDRNMQLYDVSEKERTSVQLAKKLKITHPTLSLRTDVTEAVTRAGLAALAGCRGSGVVIQIILGRAYRPSPTPTDLPDPHTNWLQNILGEAQKASAESRKTVREKANQYRFLCVLRIASNREKGVQEIRSIISAFKILESAGAHIREEPERPEHIDTTHIPWHFALQLSPKELANFLLLPIEGLELPGVPGLHPKLTLPPDWYGEPTNRQQDRSFAISLDRVMPKKLSISPQDSLEHCHLIGPTGSGKFTAMLHLILADINAGRSVLVLDPKADLVTDILARIPESRIDDVVVLDPSDPCPVGFNPLAFKDYGNPSLIADAVLSVLREIFSDSWGIYTQDVLTATLLTLVETDNATLLWILPMLTDGKFRQKITSKISDRVALQPFWMQFEDLKDTEKRQQIAPVLNKLRQFLLRPGLRSVLGQSEPKFSLMDLFTKRRIVLVPLNRGLVGSATARLLGSLIIGLTWVLALSRAKLPPERRHIVEIYIDELQDYLSLPTDLSDALAQARGLGVGMTLAHQYRDQLPTDICSGVDANTRNKIVFGLSSKDARAMAAMTPSLTPEDFMALPRYQVYTSFQCAGKNTGWIRGQTLPPPPTTQDAAHLRARSQATYGIPAARIDEEFLSIFADDNTTSGESPDDTPIGRRKR